MGGGAAKARREMTWSWRSVVYPPMRTSQLGCSQRGVFLFFAGFRVVPVALFVQTHYKLTPPASFLGGQLVVGVSTTAACQSRHSHFCRVTLEFYKHCLGAQPTTQQVRVCTGVWPLVAHALRSSRFRQNITESVISGQMFFNRPP